MHKEINNGKSVKRVYDLNVTYFDKWSKNMAYILGFIYADGYIRESENKLRFNLQLKDKVLLEKIKNELEFTGRIIEYDSRIGETYYKACRMTIGSYEITNRLIQLGLYSNKSLTIEMPTVPKEYQLDFIRGYFDGNGSIEVKKQTHNIKNSTTYQLRLRIMSGSEKLVSKINEILNQHGLNIKNVIKSKGKELYTITYSTKESYKLYDLFYKNAEIYLDRKKSKFEEGFKVRKLDFDAKLKTNIKKVDI